MKNSKLATAIAAAILSLAALSACDKDFTMPNHPIQPDALVTIKPVDANSFYMQLDEKTTLKPVNMKGSPYGEGEVRALVAYIETHDDPGPYTRAVRVSWMDDILTKPIDYAGITEQFFGDDPVEIIDDWVTIVEDGYLTLRFQTVSGMVGTKHRVSLVSRSENPYELEFCHDANGDVRGEMVDGLVAFDLRSLPDTHGQTVKLKLKWQSFTGAKEHEFDYCTRRDTPELGASVAAVRPTLKVQ